MSLHINSPLLESRTLSLAAGRPVWLKLDALQPCGSFKTRGIGHACNEYVRRGARHLVSSSGGNAGIAVAYAGRLLQVPVPNCCSGCARVKWRPSRSPAPPAVARTTPRTRNWPAGC